MTADQRETTGYQEPSLSEARQIFDDLASNVLNSRREEGLPVSSSHGETHLRGVADLIPVIGEAYGFSKKENILGMAEAFTHDLARSGREDLEQQDEEESAAIAVTLMTQLNDAGILITTIPERAAVMHGVINHSKKPAEFKDPSIRERIPEKLADRLHTVLYVADGLQKLGYPLIHRRSAFVGGERLGVNKKGEKGDLIDMTYQGWPIDPIHAVLLESAVRLGWKNSEADYPRHLERFIQEPFAIQRDWVAGLLASRGITMNDWVDILVNTTNAEGKNVFQIAKSSIDTPPQTPEEILTVLLDRGRMNDDRIYQAAGNSDLVNSSVEAVNYFSSRYLEDPKVAIAEWNPLGETARMWKGKM